jgi:hypothetical protein
MSTSLYNISLGNRPAAERRCLEAAEAARGENKTDDENKQWQPQAALRARARKRERDPVLSALTSVTKKRKQTKKRHVLCEITHTSFSPVQPQKPFTYGTARKKTKPALSAAELRIKLENSGTIKEVNKSGPLPPPY